MRTQPICAEKENNRLHDAGISLSDAPTGCRVRLTGSEHARSDASMLAAMGISIDEILVVHQRGEPTIVSLGSWNGRRIGLSRCAARRMRVIVEA